MEILDRLIAHFDSIDLDIRRTRSVQEQTGITPRFMDQKCTPDVLASCANWVLSLPEAVRDQGFTKKTIWTSRAFDYDVKVEFSKPEAHEETAQSEFDKVISQPLKTLAYAGLLKDKKVGTTIEFSVANREFIELISHGPRKARIFLCAYLECVLKQSGIFYRFEAYFDSTQTQADYLELRDSFEKFILNQTFINGKIEIRRIFPKVLNPLAHQLGLPGAQRGRVSKAPIMTSELLYNQENFRDKGRKRKGLTRQQAFLQNQNSENISNESMQRVMDAVRTRHSYRSELNDEFSDGHAAQVHHIFPRSSHPELKNIRENLILLTPTQHNSKAHPRNNTTAVDFDYQIECLLAKTTSVEQSTQSCGGDGFYDLSRLIAVINVGYSDIKLDLSSTFDEVRLMLKSYQNGLETKAVGTPSSLPQVKTLRVPGSDGREFLRKDLE